jgi:hypothetical protein
VNSFEKGEVAGAARVLRALAESTRIADADVRKVVLRCVARLEAAIDGTSVKWKRSDDGYVESTCGRFGIKPLWCGRTTPQFYDAVYRADDRTCEVIVRMVNTQREAKDRVAAWVAENAERLKS